MNIYPNNKTNLQILYDPTLLTTINIPADLDITNFIDFGMINADPNIPQQIFSNI